MGRKRKLSTAIMEAMAPNLLFVDELTIGDNDINSVVSLSPATMDTLHLSHGDPLLIQGKMGRQIVSIANIAANDTCDIGPKIRLSKVVRNQLRVRIGDVVSLRFSSNHTSGKREQQQPISLKEDDDTTDLKVSEFLNNVDDKLLFEIFVRVSDCRLAIQLSSVCKRWSSIISNSDLFIRDFSLIHDHCRPFSDDYYCSRPFTLLFRRHDLRFYTGINGEIDFEYFDPFCQVFSEKSKALHGTIPSRYFNFLPCPVAIMASYDDLVLVTNMKHAPYSGAIENYICNPLTKQWLALPKVQAPRWMSCCYGFVRDPISCNKTTAARYRVVMIGHQTYPSDLFRDKYWCRGNEFAAIVFCSETGQWSGSIISFPWHSDNVFKSMSTQVEIVASNGVLYWLEGLPLKGIVAFDPFNDLDTKQCRFIGLPTECFKNTLPSTLGKVKLGVVKGQLRLSQMYKVQSYFVFKAWELKNQDSEFPTWNLVYNLKLNSLEKRMFVLAFHPNNNNVVFLLCGNDVCRYEILEKKYEIVGKYPVKVSYRGGRISAFTLLYPSWPTQIQQLPSS